MMIMCTATKSILVNFKEFEDEILNVTMVDDEADFNPTKDLEELERLLAKEPQSNFTKIQVVVLARSSVLACCNKDDDEIRID
ncbi:hypothetical protein Tco_1018493 [Tanacetum coccineum]|uniref:Uncharacterized protein n=1 Tax=Tanacetum coccineum TaxID=301880 RepID=A0ABQ5FVX5_9ASTR